VTLRRIARFWLPLQVTWLFMASEALYLAAVIARLPEPKFNLAAHGVAYAFAIIVEAPVIMMLSAATALVDSRAGYRALRRFAHTLSGLITAVMVLLLATGAMAWILEVLVDLDPAVADLTRGALWILLPWPGAIGYRRFYQGILIRAGLTDRVAWGTVIRLATMASAALLAARAGLDGARVGAIALSAGVCAEAVASRVMARRTVRELPARPPADRPSADLSWRGLAAFYAPLALTSTISLAVQPLVTFFLGRSRASLESLAVLPVVNALVFLFRTPGLSYQETAIAMLGESRDNLVPVLRFASLLAAGAAVGLVAVTWTPLAAVWFVDVAGLSPELAAFAVLPARILALMPALSVLLSLQRAFLVHGRRTGPVTAASALEVAIIAVLLAAAIGLLDWVGATAAAVAFMAGRLAANLLLIRPVLVVVEQTKAPRT
jgi:hypothetical protein